MGNSKKRLNLVLLIVLLIVFLLLAYGAYSLLLRKTADEEGLGLAAPSLEDLETATYRLNYGDDPFASIENGEFRSSDGWASVLMHEKYAFGDLNGDGVDDAAVILVSSGGGSGSFYDLCTVTDRNSDPINSGFKHLGDRKIINEISISEGQINLDIVIHGPNDPMCCPMLDTIMRFVLVDEKITPL
jgi:hypothetical protein